MRLFVNGIQVASKAQTGAIKTSNGNLSIGGDSLYGQYFAGLIDEVRIYNRAISASEIQTDMNLPVGNPQLLAGNAIASSAAAAPPLTAAKFQPLVVEAIARWRSAIGNTPAMQNLGRVQVSVLDLPNTTLGLSSGNFIFIDKDAAGHGWFLDPTPHNDSEFAPSHVSAAVKGKVDLLSVLMHEFGHILGMDDVHVADPQATNNVMADVLPLGVRQSAFSDTASAATFHPTAERAVDSLLADVGLLDLPAQRKAKRVR